MAQKRDAPNWKKIKAEYVRGGISQRQLADKYKINRSTLQARIQREGWQQLRKDASAKTSQKLVQQTADIQADTAAKMLQMQSEAALAVYSKLMETLKSFPNGVGTKNVRETVEIKRIEINGEERDIPLHKTFTNDLEAVVRSMTALARLYGIDAASQQARERLDMQKKQDGEADDVASFNAAVNSMVEMINHPSPDRMMDEVQPQEGEPND